MKKVAITGCVSSGKSTVCRFLKELGAYVVSADEIVHNLLVSDSDIRQQIIDLLGTDVLLNNQLNKEAIAAKVFLDKSALHSLESILHPVVFQIIESKYQEVKDHPNYNLFIAEIPLLYETKNESRFDVIIVVSADEEVCKKRFVERKSQDALMFARRMKRQMPLQEKMVKANFVLVNNGDLLELKKEVKKIFNQL